MTVGRPFFEIEKWPISEITKWLAHFELEHEEYERATGKGNINLSEEDDDPQTRQNALLSILN